MRAADGTFKDIQTYKRAHSADIRKSSKSEVTKKAASKKAPARKKAAAQKK